MEKLLRVTVGIFLFIGIYSCNNSREDIKNLNSSELLNQLFNNSSIEDSEYIYKLIEDKISLNGNSYFTSIFHVDDSLEEISTNFIKLEELPLINSNYSNQVYLMNDSIKLNDSIFQLGEFIRRNKNSNNEIDVYKVIDSFDKYLNIKSYLNRYYISIGNKSLDKIQLKLLHCLFKKIANENLKSRNLVSNEKWGVDFNQLPFDKKKLAIKEVKESIHIYFN